MYRIVKRKDKTDISPQNNNRVQGQRNACRRRLYSEVKSQNELQNISNLSKGPHPPSPENQRNLIFNRASKLSAVKRETTSILDHIAEPVKIMPLKPIRQNHRLSNTMLQTNQENKSTTVLIDTITPISFAVSSRGQIKEISMERKISRPIPPNNTMSASKNSK